LGVSHPAPVEAFKWVDSVSASSVFGASSVGARFDDLNVQTITCLHHVKRPSSLSNAYKLDIVAWSIAFALRLGSDVVATACAAFGSVIVIHTFGSGSNTATGCSRPPSEPAFMRDLPEAQGQMR
jgi:hypothetical protein